jgi:uncharacterized protein
MTKTSRRMIWVTLVAVAIVIGMVLTRNSMLDSAATALKSGDGSSAERKLKFLASLGDRTAQDIVGYGYAYGWPGFAKNDEEAMRWFSRGGIFGSRDPETTENHGAAAALSIAKTYKTGGDGVTADQGESEKWMRLAAEAGSKEAATMLGPAASAPALRQ